MLNQIGINVYIYIYMYIYMCISDPSSAAPPPPPRAPPSCVVVGCFTLPVVWCGPGGSAWGGMVWVRVFLPWFPSAFLGLLWVFGIYSSPMMMMMMMGTMITIIIINPNILMFLWLVIGCLLPTCLVTIIALLIAGPIFVTVVALGQLP